MLGTSISSNRSLDPGGYAYQPLVDSVGGNVEEKELEFQPLHDNGATDDRRRQQTLVKRVIVIVVWIVAIFSLFRFLTHIQPRENDAPDLPSNSFKETKLKACSSSYPSSSSPSHPHAPPARPPVPINLWASLTIQETSEIQKWLEHPSRGLNLTRGKVSHPSDNTVFLIEAWYPKKEDALGYLNAVEAVRGASASKPGFNFTQTDVKLPARYARVTIHHGAGLPRVAGEKEDFTPCVKDYLVGPLGVQRIGIREMKMRELTEVYHRPLIPHNARGMVNGIEFLEAWKVIDDPLREVIEGLLNATIRGDPSTDGLVITGSGPWSYDGSTRRLWTTFKKNVPGAWIQSTGLYMYLDFAGTDTGLWRFLKFIYNNQYYKSKDEFIEAYHNGTIKRLPPPPSTPPSSDNNDDNWSSRKRHGPLRDLDHLPGPRAVSFAGKRFRVDKELGYVSWMGWGMYLGFDRDMGMSLWDIRFRGERIIYQLAPQEALAHYAGNDPVQSTTAWQDRYFGMGQAVSNLLPGYDCPHTAVYLPATTRTPVGSVTVERAICVFEHDTESPLTRHTSYVNGEFGVVKGYTFVVRSISTVGNYDYMFDYIFHLDGTIEVRVSASGYLQGGYWQPDQNSYGGRIRDASMGNIHDHVINFKVDFDIGGTKNSLLATTTKEEVVKHPWIEDDIWGTTIQQKITRRYIENEDDALLNYPPNFQGHFAIVNTDAKNRWGSPRGYIVHPGYNPVHTTVVGDNRRTLNNANWAKYNLAVSKRKETEPSSSSMWNMNLPGAPVVDFHRFFDGESISQEDLVAWVNVGTHHLPQAEDSPNTKMNTATSSFLLVPINHFDYDVSMESTNAILLGTPKIPGEPFTYNDYGVKQGYTCVPEAPEPFEYRDVEVFDLEGRKEEAKSAEEMREMKEMYHRMRVKMEL